MSALRMPHGKTEIVKDPPELVLGVGWHDF